LKAAKQTDDNGAPTFHLEDPLPDPLSAGLAMHVHLQQHGEHRRLQNHKKKSSHQPLIDGTKIIIQNKTNAMQRPMQIIRMLM
jgi:hypothetical protein